MLLADPFLFEFVLQLQISHMSVNVSQITGNSMFVEQLMKANNKEIIEDLRYWPFMWGICQ